MVLADGYQLLSYRSEFALATVLMWRASFQQAMALAADNTWTAVAHQLEYLASMKPSDIRVVLEESSSDIAAFFVADTRELHHLYVALAHQGRGLGGQLLKLAQEESDGTLELYVFAGNTRARQFYRHRGFEEIAFGEASKADNPWASTSEQLRDVRCRWQRAT